MESVIAKAATAAGRGYDIGRPVIGAADDPSQEQADDPPMASTQVCSELPEVPVREISEAQVAALATIRYLIEYAAATGHMIDSVAVGGVVSVTFAGRAPIGGPASAIGFAVPEAPDMYKQFGGPVWDALQALLKSSETPE